MLSENFLSTKMNPVIETIIASIAKDTEPADFSKKVSLCKVSEYRAVTTVMAIKERVVFLLPNRAWLFLNIRTPVKTKISNVKE